MNKVQAVSEVTRVTDYLRQLPSQLAADTDFLECLEALKQRQPVTFDSVWGSSCALLISSILQRTPNILIVTSDGKTQDRLIDDLPTFHDGSIERLPACLTSNESTVTVDHEFGDRLRLVKSLAAGDANPIIVASVPSLLQPLPSRASLDGQSRRIKAEQTLDVDDLTTWLTEQGFHETSAVELPGEFSSRGGIVDVFAPDWAGPVRIELFDDEVESLRQFDPGTQRSSGRLFAGGHGSPIL